jgi:hypothetical protein
MCNTQLNEGSLPTEHTLYTICSIICNSSKENSTPCFTPISFGTIARHEPRTQRTRPPRHDFHPTPTFPLRTLELFWEGGHGREGMRVRNGADTWLGRDGMSEMRLGS